MSDSLNIIVVIMNLIKHFWANNVSLYLLFRFVLAIGKKNYFLTHLPRWCGETLICEILVFINN